MFLVMIFDVVYEYIIGFDQIDLQVSEPDVDFGQKWWYLMMIILFDLG